MKISTLIQKLSEIQAEHGDLRISLNAERDGYLELDDKEVQTNQEFYEKVVYVSGQVSVVYVAVD